MPLFIAFTVLLQMKAQHFSELRHDFVEGSAKYLSHEILQIPANGAPAAAAAGATSAHASRSLLPSTHLSVFGKIRLSGNRKASHAAICPWNGLIYVCTPET